jgi:hypothetical protein
MRYRMRYRTYDIAYDIIKTYDIVGFWTVLANRNVRYRMRYRTSAYNIAYDILLQCRY